MLVKFAACMPVSVRYAMFSCPRSQRIKLVFFLWHKLFFNSICSRSRTILNSKRCLSPYWSYFKTKGRLHCCWVFYRRGSWFWPLGPTLITNIPNRNVLRSPRAFTVCTLNLNHSEILWHSVKILWISVRPGDSVKILSISVYQFSHSFFFGDAVLTEIQWIFTDSQRLSLIQIWSVSECKS